MPVMSDPRSDAKADTLACPTCARPILIAGPERPATFPFCSPRCRDRDLGAWFNGRYTVAGQELEQIDQQRSPHGVDRDPRTHGPGAE
jgi:endogenous inhibitor of DNA gyrase (YacG/DUF329 family)